MPEAGCSKIEYHVIWNVGHQAWEEEEHDKALAKFNKLKNWKPEKHQLESDIHSVRFEKRVIQIEVLDTGRTEVIQHG